MWTTENRPRYDRDKLRYPSDLTAEEWARWSHSSGRANVVANAPSTCARW